MNTYGWLITPRAAKVGDVANAETARNIDDFVHAK
jgi:hypothetical protein